MGLLCKLSLTISYKLTWLPNTGPGLWVKVKVVLDEKKNKHCVLTYACTDA